MSESKRRDDARIAAVHAATALNAGPPNLIDRFGRPLVIGAQVEYHSSIPAIFTVADIRPDLSPHAPPNLWHVILHAEMMLPATIGRKALSLTVVMLPVDLPTPPADTPPSAPAPDNDTPAPSGGIVLTD